MNGTYTSNVEDVDVVRDEVELWFELRGGKDLLRKLESASGTGLKIKVSMTQICRGLIGWHTPQINFMQEHIFHACTV